MLQNNKFGIENYQTE